MYWWNIYLIAAGVFFVFYSFGYSWMAYGLGPIEAITSNPKMFLFSLIPVLHGLAGLMRII